MPANSNTAGGALGENTAVRAGFAIAVGAGIFALLAYIRSEVHMIRDDISKNVAVIRDETRQSLRDTDRRLDDISSQVNTIGADVRVNTQTLVMLRGSLTEQGGGIRELESTVRSLAAQVEQLKKDGR